MTELAKKALLGQLEAALRTLRQCVDHCPDGEWQESHGDSPFSQVLFHALFYTDYYLGPGPEGFRDQEFHHGRPGLFRDYEELEYRLPVQRYSRQEIREYFDFCLGKARDAVAAEDETSLASPAGFGRGGMSRVEHYVHLARHIQHHAAQLGLRLQVLTGRELDWVDSGWKEG
jgi:hypothetical protein